MKKYNPEICPKCCSSVHPKEMREDMWKDFGIKICDKCYFSEIVTCGWCENRLHPLYINFVLDKLLVDPFRYFKIEHKYVINEMINKKYYYLCDYCYQKMKRDE